MRKGERLEVDELHQLVCSALEKLVGTPDSVCLERAFLITEAWKSCERDPAPVRKAKAFAHVLQGMSLDLVSNPVFAGNTSSALNAWMLAPEHDIRVGELHLVERDGLEHFLEGQVPDEIAEYWVTRRFNGGIGHLAVDLDRVVHRGLNSVLAELEANSHKGTDNDQVYRDAMAISIQAVIDWSSRYAAHAENAARQTQDPILRRAHLRVARACRWVPAHPARDLFEGLQAIVLCHLALVLEGHFGSLSIGLPDRILAPFMDGTIGEGEATELAGAFMLKIAANSVAGRGTKTQPITVGGSDPHGNDLSNDLTRCFLRATREIALGDPHLFLRWHDRLDPQIKAMATEMLADGVSMPLLINDKPTAGGIIDNGVASVDAFEYCVIGCNELGIPGRMMEGATSSAGLIQHIELLNDVLLSHPDPDSIASIGDLFGLFSERMRVHLSATRARRHERWPKIATHAPMPLTSALMRGCPARGKDFRAWMPYAYPGHYERGLTNCANALAAIEELVYEKKVLRLSEIVDAMREDFQDGAVRSSLRSVAKWGNDVDRVDRWAQQLIDTRESVLGVIDREFGDDTHAVTHVVRSLHILDGMRILASPDGRYAGTPVSDSIGAETGTAQRGPTAVLDSVLKLDARRYYRGGYNLNLTLPRDGTTGAVVLSLVEGFFGKGGQELQINVLDPQVLRAARRHPERYQDLVVRVAGLSARYIDLSAQEQDEILARAEAVAS